MTQGNGLTQAVLSLDRLKSWECHNSLGVGLFPLGTPLNSWEGLILGLSLDVTRSQVYITQSTSQELGLATITSRFSLGSKGWEVHLTGVHPNPIPAVFKPRRCPSLRSAQSSVNLATPSFLMEPKPKVSYSDAVRRPPGQSGSQAQPPQSRQGRKQL